jgi:hypothetical protein
MVRGGEITLVMDAGKQRAGEGVSLICARVIQSGINMRELLKLILTAKRRENPPKNTACLASFRDFSG